MLKAMINEIKNKIENERQERQNNQDYLFSLLEDMCNKLANTNDAIKFLISYF